MLVEPIINSHKIKYEILTPLVNKTFKSGSELVIYINLDSILNSFYRQDLNAGIASFTGKERLALSAEIINIIAHYRRYFYRYHGVRTTFIFYIFNTSVKGKYNKKYMNNLTELRDKNNPQYHVTNNFLINNIQLANMLCNYIPNAYMVYSNGYDPALIPYHFIKMNDSLQHLIITKDKYDYQLLNLDNTYILKLKYDKSEILSKDNIYDHYLKKLKYRPDIEISPKLYSLYLSILGCKSRNVEGMSGIGYSKFTKKLSKLLEDGYIKNGYNKNISKVLDLLNYNDKFSDNFYDLDLKYNYKNLNESVKEFFNSRLIDRSDNRGLMEISFEHYDKNPLRMVELMEGY